MNRMNKIMRSPYVSALLFTLFSLLLFLVTEPALSYAGDMNMAAYMGSSKIEPGFFFITLILASVLRFLSTIYMANWWAIFSITVLFGGLFVFLWFLNKRFANRDWTARLLLDGLFVLFFWELLLKYEINSTQTATTAALAGIMLILDCCYDDIKNTSDFPKQASGTKHGMIKTCLGIFLVLLSGAVRWKALALMMPFSVMCLAYFFLFPCTFSDLLKHPGRSFKNSFQTKKKFLLLAGGIVFTVLLSFGLHKLYETVNPDLGEFVKANALREEICDYMDQYPDYDSNADMYRELGIEQSWINMVRSFLTGDLNHFSSEDLNKMAGLKQGSHMTMSNFIHSLRRHTVLWISLICLMLLVLFWKGIKNGWLPLLGCVLAFFLCGLYFVMIGRTAWRVTNGCVLAGLLSFIAMTSHTVSDIAMGPHPISGMAIRNISTKEQFGRLALTAVIGVIGLICVRLEKEFSLPLAAITDEERAGMMDYMDENSGIIYLDLEDALTFYNAHNLWSSYEAEYMDNVFSLVAHFTIGEKDAFAAAGVDNIINDMLEKPNICVRYTPGTCAVFLNYLRDYYDGCISVSVVDRYGSSRFLRYSKPIVMGEEIDAGRMSDDMSGVLSADAPVAHVEFEAVDEFSEDTGIIATIQVNVHLDAKAGNTENTGNNNNSENIGNDGDVYQDYYLNITDHKADALYSYGLKAEETGCGGEILWMDGTWEKDDISVFLVGKRTNGDYEVIAAVTDEFLSSFGQ